MHRVSIAIVVIAAASSVALAQAAGTCVSAPPSAGLLEISAAPAEAKVELLHSAGSWKGCLRLKTCRWHLPEPERDLPILAPYFDPSYCEERFDGTSWVSACPSAPGLGAQLQTLERLLLAGWPARSCAAIGAAEVVSGLAERHLALPLSAGSGCAMFLMRSADGAAGLSLTLEPDCVKHVPALPVLADRLTPSTPWVMIGTEQHDAYLALGLSADGSVSDSWHEGLDAAYLASWLDAIAALPPEVENLLDAKGDPLPDVQGNGSASTITHFMAAAAIRLQYQTVRGTPTAAPLAERARETARWMSAIALMSGLNHRDAFFRAELALQ